MNRRQFVRNSLATSVAGLAGGDLLFNRSQLVAENEKFPGSPLETASKHRAYTHLLDPREHPDYTRRHVRPASWDTLFPTPRLGGWGMQRKIGAIQELNGYFQRRIQCNHLF